MVHQVHWDGGAPKKLVLNTQEPGFEITQHDPGQNETTCNLFQGKQFLDALASLDLKL